LESVWCGFAVAEGMDAEIAKTREQIATIKSEIDSKREEFDDGNFDDFVRNVPDCGRVNLKERKHLKGHFGKVYAMHWSEDNRHLVSAAQDSTLIVWNAFNQKKANWVMLISGWPMACAYSPSGNLVASGGLDNNCTIHNIRGKETPVRVPTQELSGHQGYLSGCRFLSDYQIITSSGDMTCILWDITSKRKITDFKEHEGDVMSIAMSPVDNNTFLSGSCDTLAKLWDIRTGKSVRTFAGHVSDVNAVQYFPTGHLIATGSDDASCRLFDLRSYKQLRELRPPGPAATDDDQGPGHVTSIAFSATGRFLFSGFDDFGAGSCHVWDAIKGGQAGSVPIDSRVSCMGTPRDGMALCTGGWDFTLKVWA